MKRCYNLVLMEGGIRCAEFAASHDVSSRCYSVLAAAFHLEPDTRIGGLCAMMYDKVLHSELDSFSVAWVFVDLRLQGGRCGRFLLAPRDTWSMLSCHGVWAQLRPTHLSLALSSCTHPRSEPVPGAEDNPALTLTIPVKSCISHHVLASTHPQELKMRMEHDASPLGAHAANLRSRVLAVCLAEHSVGPCSALYHMEPTSGRRQLDSTLR